ncbi:DUF7024 domain-containing protein [Desulfosoma sp.]
MQKIFIVGQWILLCAWIAFLVFTKKDIIDYLSPIPSIPFRVDMSVDGNAASYLAMKGFSMPEKWGRWSDGSRAEINFVMNPADGRSLTMVLYFDAIAGPQYRQTFAFYFNGQLVKTVDYTSPKDHTLTMDISGLIQETNHLVIKIWRPIAPRSVDPQSGDTRRLGIGLKRIDFLRGKDPPPSESSS